MLQAGTDMAQEESRSYIRIGGREQNWAVTGVWGGRGEGSTSG